MKDRASGTTRPSTPTTAEPAVTAQELFATHQKAVLVLMNSFLISYLVDMYAAFDGDLLEAVVLGEVAHHNVSGARTPTSDPASLSAALRDLSENRPAELLPTNAFSIAEATGIPRQTVRRRIDALVAKGWLRREANGSLFVTRVPTTHFESFNKRLLTNLLATASLISSLPLEGPPDR